MDLTPGVGALGGGVATLDVYCMFACGSRKMIEGSRYVGRRWESTWMYVVRGFWMIFTVVRSPCFFLLLLVLATPLCFSLLLLFSLAS